MRRVCWSGWVSAALVIGMTVVLSSCAPAPALVPPSVVQQVNADDRERNYDLAWQEIRAVAGDIDRGELSDIHSQLLVIVSRMERLERGEAGQMSDRATARLAQQFRERAAKRSAEETRDALASLSDALPGLFDPGDFTRAKEVALEMYVIAETLAE